MTTSNPTCCGGYALPVAGTTQFYCPRCNLIREARDVDETQINERRERHERLTEAAMQTQVEDWLQMRGYWPRTPDRIAQATASEPKGWYVHLHDAKRNPILGDLLIIARSGRCVEIELKTEAGVLTECQRQLNEMGWIAVARGAGEAIEMVKAWGAET